MASFAPDEVVILPLYPQYAGATTGSAMDAWKAAYHGPGVVKTVCCYPDEAGLIEGACAEDRAHLSEGREPAGRAHSLLRTRTT